MSSQPNNPSEEINEDVQKRDKEIQSKNLFSVDSAKNPFSGHGWSGMTIYDPYRTQTSMRQYCFQLCPRGIGKPSHLRSKFEIILGSIWCESLDDRGEINYKEKDKKVPDFDLHPMFKFLIKKLIGFDYLFEIKETEYFPIRPKEEIAEEGLASPFFEQKQKKINSFISEMESYFHQEKQKLKNIQKTKTKILRQELLQLYQEKVKEWRETEENKYLEILKFRDNKKQFSFFSNIQEALPKEGKGSEKHDFSDYQWKDKERMAKKLCDSIEAIQPLKLHHQELRYLRFAKEYQTYYKTLIVVIDNKQLKQEEKCMNITKYIEEPEAVLHTIEDLVFLIKKKSIDKDIKGVHLEMIKQLCIVLNAYQASVIEKGNKRFYHYLNPQNVIYDQFYSLSLKLKFEPIFEEALGLKNKPVSLQTLLSYYPTPQHFNYFRSPRQFESMSKLILSDPFFGNLELYGDQKVKLQQDDLKKIEQEKNKLKKLHQHMLVWRLLLTGYFLIQGEVFGKNYRPLVQKKIQEQFIEDLKNAKQKLTKKELKTQGESQQKWSLRKFLGQPLSPMKVQQAKRFDDEDDFYNFDDILEYVGATIQDKLLQDLKFSRLKIYHSCRNTLLKEIIKILVCDTILIKMYNVKKYMCLFVILINQMLEEAETLMMCEETKPGSMGNVRLDLSREMRLRNNKTYYEYLNSTFEKIENYTKRSPERDLQARYITIDAVGKEHFQWIKQMKEFIDNLINKVNYLKDIEEFKKKSSNGRPSEYLQLEMEKKQQEYKQLCTKLFSTMKQRNKQLKKKCWDLVLTEVNADDPEDMKNHKISNKTNTIKCLTFFNKRFAVLINSLFMFKSTNLCNYESLIIPYLNIDETEKKFDIKIATNDKELQQCSEQNEKVKFIEEMLLSQQVQNEKEIVNIISIEKPLIQQSNQQQTSSISHQLSTNCNFEIFRREIEQENQHPNRTK